MQLKLGRRNFLKGSTLAILLGGVAYGVAGRFLLKVRQKFLRPPGALDEESFLASCIKCGQCLQVCPPQVIELGGVDHGLGIGAPYITPREGACILCKGLPCVLACPTGSLDHKISEGKEAEMGLAVVVGPDRCLSGKGESELPYRLDKIKAGGDRASRHAVYLLNEISHELNEDELKKWQKHFNLAGGVPSFTREQIRIDEKGIKWLEGMLKDLPSAEKPCRACLVTCPIKDEQPIKFVRQNDPDGSYRILPEVQKSCVGCGVCEENCPTTEASIKIVPRLPFKGEV